MPGTSISLAVAARVLVVGLALGLVASAAVSWVARPPAPARGETPVEVSAGAESGPLAVLHDWDARRAAAWSAGDTEALARLYTAGSVAGAADVALLQRYADRGLRVLRMRMQVLDARVLVRRPRAITLEVVDRLAAATVDAGAASRPLPADAATTHRLALRLVGGRWRMDRVAVLPSGRPRP